jgi:hypothetical protein
VLDDPELLGVETGLQPVSFENGQDLPAVAGYGGPDMEAPERLERRILFCDDLQEPAGRGT